MGKIFEIKCERCGKRESLKWNGEHWIPSIEWTGLYCLNGCLLTDKTICARCCDRAIEPEPRASSKEE